uniref:Uncharacterized protein n=1 Tax=Balaenoptera musculus TaxID=9771 RepID=A0A8C0I5P7_BALMU
MNLFIYVLLLLIWTNTCLNTNQSDEPSTTGAKHRESMETKMDNFRRHLLIIIIGVMIIAFVYTCFCFLHYYCMSDDAPEAGKVKKEGVMAKSSRSSKISFSDSKTVSLCSPEKQSTLPGIDKLSGLSSPGKASIPTSTEKLIRPLSQEKSRKPSSPKKVFRSSHQENSSYPSKANRPPWLASLQYLVRPTKTPCPPYPQSQSLPKPSRLQKLTKRHTHPILKRSVSAGRTDILSRPQPVKSCLCYKEKCLVCRAASEFFANNISEAKKKNTQNPPFPRELKPFSKSFHKIDSRHNALCGNASDSDMMTYYGDGDSDKEITIICNIKRKEVIYKTTHEIMKGSIKIKTTHEEANLYQLFYAHHPLRP